MAQIKKKNIQDSIDTAARTLFTSKGYHDTKIGDIAREAGISIGNLYRYESGKDSLFERLYPQSLADDFFNRIQEKMSSFLQSNNMDNSLSDTFFYNFNRFVLNNSETFIVLAKKSEGSPHEGFPSRLADKLVDELKKSTLILNSIDEKDLPWIDNFIKTIYLGLFQLYLTVLESSESEETKLRGMVAINAYHVNGIMNLAKLLKERML